MMHKAAITAYSKNRTKFINALHRQKPEIFYIKACGMCKHQCALGIV
jgi:hypothetical protein